MRIASVTRKLRRFGELSLADKWLLCLLYTSDAADDNRLVLVSGGGGA